MAYCYISIGYESFYDCHTFTLIVDTKTPKKLGRPNYDHLWQLDEWGY